MFFNLIIYIALNSSPCAYKLKIFLRVFFNGKLIKKQHREKISNEKIFPLANRKCERKKNSAKFASINILIIDYVFLHPFSRNSSLISSEILIKMLLNNLNMKMLLLYANVRKILVNCKTINFHNKIIARVKCAKWKFNHLKNIECV